MTPLGELIEGASGDQVPVATLLRKVKVVAARLGTVQLEEWVGHELNGYPPEAQLPDYRKAIETPVHGNFGGPFGSGYQNAPIPSIGFPEEFRNGRLFHHEFREPIAELERLATLPDTLRSEWPADFVAYTNQLIRRGEVHLYPGMGLQQAFQLISPHHLRAIVDKVRTRILDLALSLEAIAPQAGEPGAPATDPVQLAQVVMNVFGGNVAVASSHVQQEIALPTVGDRDQLFAALASYGLEDEDLEALEQALDADEAAGAGPGKGMGERVQRWAGQLAIKGTAAAGKGATGAAGGLALKAVAAYLGIGVG